MKEYKSIDSRSPGPGAYDANSSLEHRGAVTPRAARFSSREDKSPGPGSYSSSFLTPRNSGSGFGRSKRDDIFKPTPSPGPGSYDCSSTCFTGPSFSFPQKEIIAKLPNTPGPGAYSYRFITKYPTTSSFIGKAKRPDMVKVSISPGPGRYDCNESKLRSTSPSWSIHGTNSPSLASDTPGPGKYEPYCWRSSKGFTSPKAARSPVFQGTQGPGPGRYDCEESRLRPSSPRWSIHGSKDTGFIKETPGPGEYEAYSPRRNTGYTSSKAARSSLFKLTSSPGPGRYESKDIKSPRIKYSIGKAQRPEIISNSPGPGRYDCRVLTKSSSARFGTEPKRTLEVITETANAGLVLLKPVDKSPAYTFGLKYVVKYSNGVPGPGAYETERKINSPKGVIGKGFRFIKSYSEKEELEKPGPGAYEVKPDVSKVNIIIGRAKREFHTVSDTPGPGRYNLV